MVVVVANDPIPSVSRKSVTSPIATWRSEGGRRPPAATRTRCATAARIHPMMKTTLSATRRTSSAVLMAKSTKLTLLVPDAAGYFSTATRTPDGRCGVR